METVSEFRVTFGAQYPREPHPTWPAAHHDGWVTIPATDYEEARRIVVARIGLAWSTLYEPDEWEPEWFPAGELARWETDGDAERVPAPCPVLNALYDLAGGRGGGWWGYYDPEHALHPPHSHEAVDGPRRCEGWR